MEIRALDASALADDVVMREFYDLTHRSEGLGREHLPQWSFEEFLGAFRSADSGECQELFAAYDGDRMIANATLWTTLLDNTDKAFFDLQVDLPDRRRGIGRAMLAHLEQLVREKGRTLIMAGSYLPYADRDDHAYRRFAEACGYDLFMFEVVRHLALPIPDDRIQEWLDESAPRRAGYTTETYVGAVPDELVESLCVLLAQLAVDAPSGVVDFDEEVMTPQRYAEAVEIAANMGRARYETVALTAEREVVAQSTLVVPLGESTHAYQWGTFVHREHRGHQLGLAVKAVNLRAVQAARPDLTLISTRNAETNDYMVAINDRLGFQPVEVAAEFVKHL
jgi:GNAT superfamily N-acetyltransferase